MFCDNMKVVDMSYEFVDMRVLQNILQCFIIMSLFVYIHIYLFISAIKVLFSLLDCFDFKEILSKYRIL
jgi:hypothetical protein